MHAAADRLTPSSLLERVTAVLDRSAVRYALIGAAALAVYGVGRSTRDIDLFTLTATPLDDAWWEPLTYEGVRVRAARGAADDPLGGVVRLEQDGERPVDLVVGRYRWQQRVIARAASGRRRDGAACRERARPRVAQVVCRWRAGRVGYSTVARR